MLSTAHQKILKQRQILGILMKRTKMKEGKMHTQRSERELRRQLAAKPEPYAEPE